MRHWPHAPIHVLDRQGAFFVTGATLHKRHFFASEEARDFLQERLFAVAKEYRWRLEAWAVFSNHYHFVAQSPEDPATLSTMLKKLHHNTAKWINLRDGTPGRRVWFQFWDTLLTFEKSYLARLSYVHRNPVWHKCATSPVLYRWGSAAWLERFNSSGMFQTLMSYPIDQLEIEDDFD